MIKITTNLLELYIALSRTAEIAFVSLSLLKNGTKSQCHGDKITTTITYFLIKKEKNQEKGNHYSHTPWLFLHGPSSP